MVVIYPGFRGETDGYKGKYQKIAQMLVEKNIGAVIRMSNFPIPDVDYEKSVKEQLQEALFYVLKNAEEICGNENPALYLMGVSAGASAIAAIAYQYPQVEKILLVAMSGDAGIENMKHGLENYSGKLYMTVGADDRIAGTEITKIFFNFATKTKTKKLIIVPECDHQFRGEKNGKIFSKAPFWAFKDDETYPSPDGGIKLYD